jgi:hypothetical protein
MRNLAIAMLFLLFCIALDVRCQPVCPSNFPAESPVPSYSPDDIPATNVDIVTYTGAYAKAQANHNMAFVQISPNDQRVWFFVDPGSAGPFTFYNRRVRDTETSPWYWSYSYSPAVTVSGPSAVLYSPTPRYFDSASGSWYKFLMYQIQQPSACNGVVAGFLYISFSNDGICWTPSQRATHSGGPSFPCLPGATDTIPIEQMSAIDGGGDQIWLVGVEGNANELAPAPDYTGLRWSHMSRTLTNVGWAYLWSPGWVTLLTPSFELSVGGMFLPTNGPANLCCSDRYFPYAYFLNMQIAYDQSTGEFFIGRGYPYSFDRGSREAFGYLDDPYYNNAPSWDQIVDRTIPGPRGDQSVEGCADVPYLFPNRIQVYKMAIGSLSNISQITTGGWTLVADLGGGGGYPFRTMSPYTTSTPLVAGQTNYGRDFGAVSFLRDGQGNLVRIDGVRYIFGSDTLRLSKGVGRCRTTGLERETLVAIP